VAEGDEVSLGGEGIGVLDDDFRFAVDDFHILHGSEEADIGIMGLKNRSLPGAVAGRSRFRIGCSSGVIRDRLVAAALLWLTRLLMLT
jgi:hypothetical protein